MNQKQNQKLSKLISLVNRTLVVLEFIKIIHLLIMNFSNNSSFSPTPDESIISTITMFLILFLIYLYYKKESDVLIIFVSLLNLTLILSNVHTNNNFQLITILMLITGSRYIILRIIEDVHKVNKIISNIIVLQISVLYLFAALDKINFKFFTGYVFIDSFRDFFIIPSTLNPISEIYIGLAILVVTFEIILSLQIFFKKTSLIFIQSAGFAFHFLMVILIGSDLSTALHLLVFGVATCCTYPLFKTSNWVDDKWIVYWDYECDFCSKAIELARKFDSIEFFNFVSNKEVLKLRDIPFNKNLIEKTIIIHNVSTDDYLIASRAMIFLYSNNFYLWPFLVLGNVPYLHRFLDFFYFKFSARRQCNISQKFN